MSEIISVTAFKDRIEVVKRQRSNIMYACIPPRPAPDTVWMEVYRAEGSNIYLSDSIKGKHVPATSIPESFDFTPVDPNVCPDCGCDSFELDTSRNEKICSKCKLVLKWKMS